MKIKLSQDFRSAIEYPESWGQFNFLFEGRDRLHPFLVLHEDTIIICDSIAKVKRCDDDDLVLKQWPGKYRSDWFYMTAGQFKGLGGK